MTILSEIKGIPLEQEPGLGALTLSGFLAEVVQNYGSKEALCWTDLNGNRLSWTYNELLEESQKVAKSLLSLGVGRDTRVGVLISNRPEWLFSMFGISMAGGVTVAISTFSTQHELHHQLKIADVEMLITEAEVASRNFIEDIFALCPDLADVARGELMTDEFPYLRRVICIDKGYSRPGLEEWNDFIAAGDQVSASLIQSTANATAPIDQALIFFSSGSTALPKAIQQTHRAATLQCWRTGKLFEFDRSVRTWNANGYFFSGNFALAFGTLSVGGCLVLLRYFEPDKALELIQEEKVTCVIAWPHQEARLKECPGWKGADFSSVTRVNSDSAFRSHPSTNIEWQGFNGYGMTETFTFVAAVSGAESTRGSQGTVWPGNTVRIVDPETNEILPMGQTGEIIVKGPTLTSGYLKVPPEELFDDEGFIHTADAGYFGDDGHLFWKGRLSEIIKTGGANVSPTEIDAILFEHPAVQSSCTIGIPHDTLGEMVVSCVILHEDQPASAEELCAYAKQYLASYKVPRKVAFFKEEELPMTGSNKVKRSDLKEIVVGRLRGEE